MDDNQFTLIIVYAVLTLFTFFATAPVLLNMIAQFGVVKKFSYEMVDEGVIDEETVKSMLRSKQIAGIFMSLIALAVPAYLIVKTFPFGIICFVLPLALGFLRYRKVVQFNSMTVNVFRRTFKGKFSAEKLDRYVKKTFELKKPYRRK